MQWRHHEHNHYGMRVSLQHCLLACLCSCTHWQTLLSKYVVCESAVFLLSKNPRMFSNMLGLVGVWIACIPHVPHTVSGVMSWHVISCHLISCHVMSCDVTSCFICPRCKALVWFPSTHRVPKCIVTFETVHSSPPHGFMWGQSTYLHLLCTPGVWMIYSIIESIWYSGPPHHWRRRRWWCNSCPNWSISLIKKRFLHWHLGTIERTEYQQLGSDKVSEIVGHKWPMINLNCMPWILSTCHPPAPVMLLPARNAERVASGRVIT